jgi:hypothetical protein
VQKLILMSILVLSIALPVRAAAEPRPGLALRKAVWWMVAAIVGYTFAVVFVYPRFVG